jgi:hypothetical protein
MSDTPKDCPKCGAKVEQSSEFDDDCVLYRCDTEVDPIDGEVIQSKRCRIRELERAALATDAQIADLQERWRLMGEHLNEAANREGYYRPENVNCSMQWGRGYDFAATMARRRYNELTPSSGSAAEE